MRDHKNIPYFLTAVGLFILAKFGYTVADTANLTFLLSPTVKLVELLTGAQAVYLSENGYYFESLNILVEKSCSGFNFWVLCFLLFTYLLIRYFDKPLKKVLIIPCSIICAYLLTIFVNSSRIFVSIVVQDKANLFLPERPHLILHEIVGIITNLTFLVLAYYLLEKRLIKNRQNAKLT